MAKILVADDTRAITDTIEHILVKEGHEVIKAYDGKEAIDLLKQNAVDLVLTDMLMPEMDGFDVINHIKGHIPDTKIIVMTGGGVAITPQQVIRSVGDDISIFLTKPIGKSELVQAVVKALGE